MQYPVCPPFAGTSQLVIYDISGKQQSLAAFPVGTSTWELDMRNLPAGTYMAEIATGTGKLRRSVFKR